MLLPDPALSTGYGLDFVAGVGADAISTPMLVIHGDRDYRVPVGEDLVSRHRGAPDELPHRFLYVPTRTTGSDPDPQNAAVWYQTVTAFLDHHVLGRTGRPPTCCGNVEFDTSPG